MRVDLAVNTELCKPVQIQYGWTYKVVLCNIAVASLYIYLYVCTLKHPETPFFLSKYNLDLYTKLFSILYPITSGYAPRGL